MPQMTESKAKRTGSGSNPDKKDEVYTEAVTKWVEEAGIKEDLGALD